jgi:molybdopterin converting factor subunit 1
MKVRVKLFAVAKDLAGCDELIVDVPEGATVATLREKALATAPALAQIMPHALWAVGAEYARDDTVIAEKTEVALIPPVSGG